MSEKTSCFILNSEGSQVPDIDDEDSDVEKRDCGCDRALVDLQTRTPEEGEASLDRNKLQHGSLSKVQNRTLVDPTARPLQEKRRSSTKAEREPVLLDDSIWRNILRFLELSEAFRGAISATSKSICRMVRSQSLRQEMRLVGGGDLFCQRLISKKKYLNFPAIPKCTVSV